MAVQNVPQNITLWVSSHFFPCYNNVIIISFLRNLYNLVLKFVWGRVSGVLLTSGGMQALSILIDVYRKPVPINPHSHSQSWEYSLTTYFQEWISSLNFRNLMYVKLYCAIWLKMCQIRVNLFLFTIVLAMWNVFCGLLFLIFISFWNPCWVTNTSAFSYNSRKDATGLPY